MARQRARPRRFGAAGARDVGEPVRVWENPRMDELDRALAAAQKRYEERIRAEVDEKLRTQQAIAWFGQWAIQVGMPTLTRLADRLIAAGHKAVVAPKFDATVEVVTELTLSFTQENGPGA